MNILYCDIETAPSLGYFYSRYKINISPDQIVEQGFMLCFQYAWNDGPVRVKSISHKGKLKPKDDKELVLALADLVAKADVVVAHNGVRFDLAILSARLAAHKLKPFPYPQVVDTLKECRKHFKFGANSLDAVCQELGIGRKGHSGGYENTLACMQGDKDAWAKLLKYGKQDVVLLRELYKRIRPFMRIHPKGGDGVCKACGSFHVSKRGFSVTARGYKQRYQCNDCGAWGLR